MQEHIACNIQTLQPCSRNKTVPTNAHSIIMFKSPSNTLATKNSLEGNSPSGTIAKLRAISPDMACLATLEAPLVPV